MKKKLTVEEQIQKAYDVAQIKNLMGRHAFYHEYNRHNWEMDELWVKKDEHKPDTTFAQGHGFQVGYDLVDDNYNTKSFRIFQLALNDIRKENPEVEDKFENLGTGTMIIHQIGTSLVEVAEDGETAQGTFDGNGQITQVYPDEITTKVMFERYNCDFVKEDGEWKIWKMFIATDICCEPAGSDWREAEINITGEMEFKLRDLEEEDPETDIILNHPMLAYTAVKNCPDWPPFPEPYKTYADTIPNDITSHPSYKEEA